MHSLLYTWVIQIFHIPSFVQFLIKKSMKHILFVIPSFRHGGINKSLENLLSIVDVDRYKIDVFAMEQYGPYSTMLDNCKVLHKEIFIHALISNWKDTKGKERLISFFVKFIRKLFNFFSINITINIYKLIAKRLCEKAKYDTVIAYSEGVSTEFVSCFKNQIKVAWIHCDYSSYLKLNNYPNESKVYSVYKSIVCVSEYTRSEFCRHIPALVDRVYAIHNTVNIKLITELSKESTTDDRFNNYQFNIISIGRIDPVKRFSSIPMIANLLINSGCKFKWYVIGENVDVKETNKLNEDISKLNLEDYVTLLGSKINPYPYIANSQLLVNLSVSEACPYVINEAKILKIPVVCTDFGSATEFVTNDFNGYISPINQIHKKIELLIKNEKEYKKIKNNYKKIIGFKNEISLNQIYNLL